MITDTGKNIIGKYLLGQAPAYASYIAVGCGSQPLLTATAYGDYSAKQDLDFEMFRVPISSRGFVTENNITKLVLTAELPTEERYEMSEIGIFSAGTNPSAGASDSKTVFAFTQGENWQYYSATSAVTITTQTSQLDSGDDNVIDVAGVVFQTNADNPTFFKSGRTEIFERCRFFNNTILMKGNSSTLTASATSGLSVTAGSDYIGLTGIGTAVDFTKNSPTDELRLAFSVVNTDGDTGASPTSVKILVEFAAPNNQFARFVVNATNNAGGFNFSQNRYYVVKKQLQELSKTAAFTWDAVNIVRVYSSVVAGGVISPDYYVALDALRLENTSSNNPLYGMTGYTVVKNTDGETIIKAPNTSNYVEFRFSVGVS